MLRCTSMLPIQRHWSHLIIVVYWSVLFAGCANTCFVAVSNPPNGTIGILAGNPPPACSLTTAKGAVRVITRANRVCEFCSESNRLKSIVLSLKGIDIHWNENRGDDSSGWLELYPQLEKQPLQVDLLNETSNGSPVDFLAERVLIPAGTYDLLRFRLAPNQPGADEEVPAMNACGKAGSNCVVMADGQIVPLLYDAAALESRFASETTADRSLLVMSGSDTELLIDLTPVESIGASFGKGVRFFFLLPSRTTVVQLIVPG